MRAKSTYKIARSAVTGHFISMAAAKRSPATSVIETIRVSWTSVRHIKRRRPAPRRRR